MRTQRLFATGALFLSLAMTAGTSQALMITYGPSGWNTNEGLTGNYILTVDDNTPGRFSYNVTVDPWNAEVLGLFIDLGDVDVGGAGAVDLADVTPTGQVVLFDTDTTSDDCGAGCNLNGFDPALVMPDGEWELVFRMGSQGFNNIQTFSFTTSDFGLDLSSFATVAFRAQQLCDPGDTLPGDESSCTGSDKASLPGPNDDNGGGPPTGIPEPSVLLLFGSGLLGLLYCRRRHA